MYKRHQMGKISENKAIDFLKRKEYCIIEHNFQCRQGEIDIIAKDNASNEYVFIEVKARSNFKYGKPVEAVNKIKQKHIIEATKYYLYKNNLENQYIRFDIITLYNNRICHYKNCEFTI